MRTEYQVNSMTGFKIYIVAALITAVFPVSGLLFDNYYSRERERTVQQELLDLQTSLTESQLELAYITEFGGDCDVLNAASRSLRSSLASTNRRLESYREYLVSDQEFTRLKSQQTILYVQLWMLTLKMREQCEEEINTVLYFFDVDSFESRQQGYVLDAITNEYGNTTLVVPLDAGFNSGIIKILKQQFKVTSTPFVVVNEKVTLEGVQTKSTILAALDR